MGYINRGIEPTELPGREVTAKAERRARMGSTDQRMVNEAQSQLSDSGIRCFWREDPQLKFTFEEVRLYLQVKARSGEDLEAKADLEELLKQNDAMKATKTAFHEAHDLQTKKALAQKYKSQESELMRLLSKGSE